MKNQPQNQSRRDFLKASTALGAFTILPSSGLFGNNAVSPNEKINLAVIGCGNQGNNDRRSLLGSGHCNVVALCDVDMEGGHTYQARYQHGLAPAPAGKENEVYPHKAKGYTDFRVMFDEMADEIDAVLVATPDHSHFAAAMLAMSLGKHVFVEKPLAHTFGQCERLIKMAAKNPNLVTQMGNQGFSGANYFQFKAWSEAGVIKDITRITAHMNRRRRWHGWGTTVANYPEDPMPEDLAWEVWHATVPTNRPFSKRLHPQEWRSWYDFGCGAFGDWGPHILDTCHHFLKLGMPTAIRALGFEGINASGLVYPQASTIQFAFPERGPGLPACDVTWYDGTGNKPKLEGEYTDSGEPEELNTPGKVLYSKDLVFMGASHASPLQIVPRQKFMDMRKSLPRFPQKNSNHYENFLLACKGEEESRSPFGISGPLSQVFNLGILAQQFGSDLEFDPESKQITNNPIAQELLDPAPRKGWEEFYNL
ncbi:oxidoreductase [Coraliomargarita sinensis]|uniref:Oxidoreductase n=1 Tax=Coraliomargarita sinensis TaxID=2174842 RepID=A0A317ZK27_9BACT|nr:Gfo/Idh/MocA family oxidoreductase [Coraliomargarita sinensis]PXA04298.1 oxidoreductase [Coraliomargarita sinensis]